MEWWMIMEFGFGRLNAGGELCMCILEFGFNYIGEQSIAYHSAYSGLTSFLECPFHSDISVTIYSLQQIQ